MFDRRMKPEPHLPPARFHTITELLFMEIRHVTSYSQMWWQQRRGRNGSLQVCRFRP